MLLSWHDYRYYPYERELAVREASALFNSPTLREVPGGLELESGPSGAKTGRLTYFSAAVNDWTVTETLQSQLERAVRVGKTRQATRYSVHGLHEYKGKFNPQVAKALLNILGVPSGASVVDPFCGSGTTLVECAHSGVFGYGFDLNPFAVFLANAKLHALDTPSAELQTAFRSLSEHLASGVPPTAARTDARIAYLQSWFTPDVLDTIEVIRTAIEDFTGPHAAVFLMIASDLLRDYSLQDPKDLRIRRRKSPLPNTPFPQAFSAHCRRFLGCLERAQSVLGTALPRGKAEQGDATTLASAGPFDAAITSPPYATALPYVDTQRLSLIWLGLLEPSDISRAEAELIGSREIRGGARHRLAIALASNAGRLPKAELEFCRQLQASLTERDGFRRQAVPSLLYRYLVSMRDSFRAIRGVMRPKASFALIVGRNHTVLGGVRYDIDTPGHLAAIAADTGWSVEELVPLQTYRRYGYHASNAVRAETLVILRNE